MTEPKIDKIIEILERYDIIITDELLHEIREIMLVPYKMCKTCRLELTLNNFTRIKDKKDGTPSYRNECNTCHTNSRTEYFKKYNEKRRLLYKVRKNEKEKMQTLS